MLELGKARRKLGQKQGEWTLAMNEQMMSNMGADSNGAVSCRKFVDYFDARLEHEETAFKEIIDQFLTCAKTIRTRKGYGPAGSPRSPSPCVSPRNLQQDNDRVKQISSYYRSEETRAMDVRKEMRITELQRVYREFDMDHGGDASKFRPCNIQYPTSVFILTLNPSLVVFILTLNPSLVVFILTLNPSLVR